MLQVDFSYKIQNKDSLAFLQVYEYLFQEHPYCIFEGLSVTGTNLQVTIGSGRAFFAPKVCLVKNDSPDTIDLNSINSQPLTFPTVPDGHHVLMIALNAETRSAKYSLVIEMQTNKWDNPISADYIVLGIVQVQGGIIVDIVDEYGPWKRVEFPGGSGSGGPACTITRTDPVPEDHGGVEAGTILTGLDACTVLEMILWPYQYPEFTSFYIQGQNTQLEVGDSVTGGVRTFVWTTINDYNIQPNTITIADTVVPMDLIVNTDNDGTEDLDIGANKTMTSPGSYTWRISALNTKSQTFSRDFVVNWLYRKYWGTNANETLTASDILALENSALSNTYAGTYNFVNPGEARYYYVVYPDSFGSFSSWYDSDTGFGVDFSDAGTVDVTNSFGVTITYRVWRTTYLQNGDLNSIME